METLIAPEVIAQIEKGKTTLADAIALLGEPAAEMLAFDETISRIWFSAKTRYFTKGRLERLVLHFDAAEVVEEFVITEEELN